MESLEKKKGRYTFELSTLLSRSIGQLGSAVWELPSILHSPQSGITNRIPLLPKMTLTRLWNI
jgi:hypothetical protein